MLGFVILIGTVVNNPILIVHQSLNHMREDGMSPSDAILESVRTRIRPIFMTTMTTVLGLLPLVLFPGAGSELYRGLGSVVLGGLFALDGLHADPGARAVQPDDGGADLVRGSDLRQTGRRSHARRQRSPVAARLGRKLPSAMNRLP